MLVGEQSFEEIRRVGIGRTLFPLAAVYEFEQRWMGTGLMPPPTGTHPAHSQ